MPTPRTKTAKTTAKPVVKSAAKPAARPSTRSSAPKVTTMEPNRRAQRSTYAKMGAALNNMGKKK